MVFILLVVFIGDVFVNFWFVSKQPPQKYVDRIFVAQNQLVL